MSSFVCTSAKTSYAGSDFDFNTSFAGDDHTYSFVGKGWDFLVLVGFLFERSLSWFPCWNDFFLGLPVGTTPFSVCLLERFLSRLICWNDSSLALPVSSRDDVLR